MFLKSIAFIKSHACRLDIHVAFLPENTTNATLIYTDDVTEVMSLVCSIKWVRVT